MNKKITQAKRGERYPLCDGSCPMVISHGFRYEAIFTQSFIFSHADWKASKVTGKRPFDGFIPF